MNKELHSILGNLSKKQLIDIIVSQNSKIEQLELYKKGIKDSQELSVPKNEKIGFKAEEIEKIQEDILKLKKDFNRTQPFIPQFPQPQPINPLNPQNIPYGIINC